MVLAAEVFEVKAEGSPDFCAIERATADFLEAWGDFNDMVMAFIGMSPGQVIAFALPVPVSVDLVYESVDPLHGLDLLGFTGLQEFTSILGETTLFLCMDITHALVAVVWGDGELDILHFCGFNREPVEEDYRALADRLQTDSKYGMIGEEGWVIQEAPPSLVQYYIQMPDDATWMVTESGVIERVIPPCS